VNGSGQNKIYANADRMQTRIEALGRFGANEEGGVSRVSFSEADVAGRGYIQQLMRSAGLNVRIDAAGNVIGRRAGRETTYRRSYLARTSTPSPAAAITTAT
jgi:N-carbamoyl-L-amino-acid hydrolase